MEESFISFHDLSPFGRYTFVSASVKGLLGFEPEELLGRPAYDLFYPPDLQACQRVHHAIVAHTKVASVCFFRYEGVHLIGLIHKVSFGLEI
jgi:PAS domain-containing protein